MHSEIRTTQEGKRFLLVAYNNQTGDWGAALAEAHNRHPGCKHLPCIAVSDTYRHRIDGEPSERPLRMALDARQEAQGAARNDDQAQGIHSGTPETINAKNAPISPYRWERRWENKISPPNAGRGVFPMFPICFRCFRRGLE
jgi:hypothetical protein